MKYFVGGELVFPRLRNIFHGRKMANLFSPDGNFFRSRNFLSIENFSSAENFLSIENFFINRQLLFIDPQFHHRSRMHFLLESVLVSSLSL